MKIKTSELEDEALDFAVAQFVNPDLTPRDYQWFCLPDGNPDEIWRPSEKWSQGGPLIDERIERIDTVRDGKEERYIATTGGWPMGESRGKTILIAAMRAIVASEKGEEVEVPDELLST